jgi:hypothetical protein
MKKLLKPACIGFYILMLLFFFVVGLYFAAAIDAGKGQGLAGGAIVLGYGVLFAGIAFVGSFFIAYFLDLKIIKIINWVLLILLLASWSYTYYQFQQRDKIQEEERREFKPESTTPTTEPSPTAFLSVRKKNDRAIPIVVTVQNDVGMGFFKPNYFENPTLYFYGNLNLEKSLQDHSPYDSITFKQNEYGQHEIATAPPWLVPEHLKLDYDLLYFKLISISEEFAEIVVNKTIGQTSYVSKQAGKVISWQDFLLSVNSVEFPESSKGKVHDREFENSGRIQTPFEFMRPIRIKGEWMEVLLIDDNFKTVGKGWIRWLKDDRLLIKYNLLS